MVKIKCFACEKEFISNSGSKNQYCSIECVLKKKKKNKYKAEQTYVDGYRFDSIKESEYYKKLKLRKRAGDIKYFLRQVPLHLSPEVTYRIDFLVIDNEDRVSYVEVKGCMTSTAKAKISLAEQLFDININIVNKV